MIGAEPAVERKKQKTRKVLTCPSIYGARTGQYIVLKTIKCCFTVHTKLLAFPLRFSLNLRRPDLLPSNTHAHIDICWVRACACVQEVQQRLGRWFELFLLSSTNRSHRKDSAWWRRERFKVYVRIWCVCVSDSETRREHYCVFRLTPRTATTTHMYVCIHMYAYKMYTMYYISIWWRKI